MSDQGIPDLSALTGVNLAGTDEFEVVDKSDTTMSADGTNKRMTADELAIGMGSRVGLIKVHTHNPGTEQNVATTSTTFADVDATNLAVTFTAPPSGKVMFVAYLAINIQSGTVLAWNLRDGSGDISGTEARVSPSGVTSLIRINNRWYRTGLTPGTSYTYKLGHARSSGSGTAQTRWGGTAADSGAAVFEVVAAP